jgi:outer membrane protein TolC
VKHLLVTLLLATPSAAWAEAPGLKQLLDAADAQNLDRRIAGEARERAEADFRQAWGALMPSFLAQGVWTNNQYDAAFDIPDTSTTPPTVKKLVIVPTNQFDGVLRVDLPIIDVGRWARLEASFSTKDGASMREESMRDIVRRQVVSSWYAYAASLAVRDSAQRSAAVAEAQRKQTEMRAAVGQLTELDLLRARAEVQRTAQVIADADALVSTTRRMVQSLTGLDPGEGAALPTDDLRPEEPFDVLEKRIDGLPAVRAADSDLDATSHIATAARLALVPSVGAQFTERFTNATGFSGRDATYNAGMTLTWRLDVPTFMAYGSVRAAEATAELLAEKARLQARDQVHADWQRFTAALRKIESARAQVDAARRASEVAKDRYAAGASTQVDVIQSDRDLFAAEVGQIQARTELAVARASLHLSAGLPLGIE